MNCPVCAPRQSLVLASGPRTLPARVCPGCGGRWVRNADYLAWMKSGAPADDPGPRPERGPDAEPALRRCPDCQYVLARFRVGEGIAFAIDHCRNCAGTWLDASEWDALRERGLHDDLLHVFTDEWQQSVRDGERRARLDAEFRARVGEADYARLLQAREWLDAHPRRPELLAFLQARPRSAPHAPA